MDIVLKLFSLQALMVAGTLESLVTIKFLSSNPNSYGHFTSIGIIFLANYALYAVFWLLVYQRFLSPLRHISGPRSLLTVVHRNLFETKRPAGELLLDLSKEYPDDELLSISAWETQLLITKPRLLADLLVHRAYDFIKPPRISGFLRHVLGDGLIIVEGDQHKFLRKNTMPAFSFRHIKDLYPMIWGKANVFTSTLQSTAIHPGSAGSDIELSGWASKVTLDIIGIAGLGRNFGMLRNADDPLLKIYEGLLDPAPEKLIYAFAGINFGLPFVRTLPWKMNETFNDQTQSLGQLCLAMIQEKKEAIAKKADDHFDILSLLIKSNNFSDAELKGQLLTFLAAGHETTSSSLTWACYLLAKHPDMQTKLRDEIREAFPAGSSDEQPLNLVDILEGLPYLNGIINETLRLYPTVPITMRTAICDTRLGDQPIPKGTVVIISMWLMNRSPGVWGADAAVFRPDRWISDTGKPNQTGGASSNYQFLTFLHGPRSCIGQGFAKAELRCLIAALVRSFSWELNMDESKIIPRGVVTIKPASGLHIKLKPVDAAG